MNLHTLRKTLVTKLPSGMQRFIKHHYYFNRLQEGILEQEFDVIQHLVKPGQQALDVGANIGVYTVYLAGLVGPTGHVYAMEPIPETFDVLRYVTQKQNQPQITVYNYAISDKAGTVAMEVPNSADGTPNYYRANLTSTPKSNSGQMVTNIQAFPLDDLFAEKPIAFIKCDVEGHELALLRGAQALIRRAQPAWFIEVSGDPDQAGSSAQQVVETMQAAGYGCFWYDGTALRARKPGDKAVNYFFLADRHVALLEKVFSGPVLK